MFSLKTKSAGFKSANVGRHSSGQRLSFSLVTQVLIKLETFSSWLANSSSRFSQTVGWWNRYSWLVCLVHFPGYARLLVGRVRFLFSNRQAYWSFAFIRHRVKILRIGFISHVVSNSLSSTVSDLISWFYKVQQAACTYIAILDIAITAHLVEFFCTEYPWTLIIVYTPNFSG